VNKIPDDNQRHEERRPQTSSLSDRPFEDIEKMYLGKKKRYTPPFFGYKRFLHDSSHSDSDFHASTRNYENIRTEYTRRLKNMKKKGFWRSIRYNLYLRHLIRH